MSENQCHHDNCGNHEHARLNALERLLIEKGILSAAELHCRIAAEDAAIAEKNAE